MNSPFIVFSLIFGLAVCAGMVARAFKQPAFLGHVLVGAVVGYLGIARGGEVGRLLDIMSSAGVMLLLFLVGLEMDITGVRKIGEKIVVVGIGQILITGGIFSLLAWQTGISISAGLFLGVSIALSSTIIVIKLLSEKHDLDSLPGRIAVALLLIQDLAAIIMLIVFSKSSSSGFLDLIMKVVVLILFSGLMAKKIMPKILHNLARSMDELILFSLAWCFVLAALVASPIFDLSLEIGGFLAGLALSGSFEHVHIATKIKPIRDFFLSIFFVGLGLNMRFDQSVIMAAFYLSVVVIVAKPMVVWILLRLNNFKQRVAFNTAILFGQISEFSFIMVGLGFRADLVSQSWVSLISLVGMLTMVVSGYLIIDKEKVFQFLKPCLDLLWKDNRDREAGEEIEISDHVILFGCHRMGKSILMHLVAHEKILVVDFDPEVVSNLEGRGIRALYADASDIETYDRLNLAKAKMVISTLKDINDNLTMLFEMKKRKLKTSVVMDAESIEDARTLYEAGATYVIFPHFVGGLHLGDLVKNGVREKSDFEKYRKYQQEIMADVYA